MPGTPLNGTHLAKNGGNLGGDDSSFLSTITLTNPRWERDHQTKLAKCVFTYALHDKLSAKGSRVKAVAEHSGIASTSDFCINRRNESCDGECIDVFLAIC
mmetsp:Transcript_733/g.1330  ORF Transcript_733/g.1330 Transcript_733/m.1330 type:complete len:101 (-) Transcript_733:518-820(-)